MMKPMMKKLLLGIPTVTLSAVLACTLAGCGGNAPSGSGGSAPVQEKTKKVKAYESQTVEVAGITYESVAHGTFYRGDAKLQDGFYLHIKITNNNTKNRTFSSFNVHAAQGDLETGDPLFTSGKVAVLDYVASEAPDELHEGIDLSNRPDIGPGETVEYVYFWAPKTAYYGPITVEFVDAYAPAKNHEAMHLTLRGVRLRSSRRRAVWPILVTRPIWPASIAHRTVSRPPMGTRWIRPTKSTKRQISSTTRLEDA